jgi:cell cycle checkpoint control protein RAD9A
MLKDRQALIPVFKGRAVDPTREKDTSIEKCDVVVEDGPGEVKSRFIIKMTCRNGRYESQLDRICNA